MIDNPPAGRGWVARVPTVPPVLRTSWLTPSGFEALIGTPELFAIMVQHAYRGIRVQFVLRSMLLVFMALAVVVVPPSRGRTAATVIVAVYALWSIAVSAWAWRGGTTPIVWMWVALVVDAAALSALTVVAGESAEQTWTADLLINGFFVLPLLAATQLRPLVSAGIAGCATVAYFVASVATKTANTEPWGSILLRTLVLLGLSVGCVYLSRLQLSRVINIGQLVQARTALLNELITMEARERATLAEQLHDGALQYVLAARQDLAELREHPDPETLDRVERALVESSGLLRETVTQLHPAVLKQAGLTRAVRDLGATVVARTGLDLDIDVAGWPEGTTELDGLLYGCARELLTNVVKHAHAGRAVIELAADAGVARLVVADDGVGLAPEDLAGRLAEGHIGLASLRTRIAAASGHLTVGPGPAGNAGGGSAGTVVTVTVPLPDDQRPRGSMDPSGT